MTELHDKSKYRSSPLSHLNPLLLQCYSSAKIEATIGIKFPLARDFERRYRKET